MQFFLTVCTDNLNIKDDAFGHRLFCVLFTIKKYILLSNGLPEEEELEDVMESASYSLLKRSSFVDSPDYAEQQMRKRDLYVFGAGSCFCKTFRGMLVQERNGGTHPIYRYERALFLEVDI